MVQQDLEQQVRTLAGDLVVVRETLATLEAQGLERQFRPQPPGAKQIAKEVAKLLGQLKTSGGGYFLIPAGPATGTVVVSSTSANTYGSWVEMIASTTASLLVGGVTTHWASGASPSNTRYMQIDIAVGAVGDEVSVGEIKYGTQANNQAERQSDNIVTLPFPIPIAGGVRVICRAADDNAAARNCQVTLLCINQSDVVKF